MTLLRTPTTRRATSTDDRATTAPRRVEDPGRRSAGRRSRGRGPDLERQSISFTVGLYLFICVALLLAHVTAGGA